nr:hypothetical protein [Mycobacterium tuberculosis]
MEPGAERAVGGRFGCWQRGHPGLGCAQPGLRDLGVLQHQRVAFRDTGGGVGHRQPGPAAVGGVGGGNHAALDARRQPRVGQCGQLQHRVRKCRGRQPGCGQHRWAQPGPGQCRGRQPGVGQHRPWQPGVCQLGPDRRRGGGGQCWFWQCRHQQLWLGEHGCGQYWVR